MTQPKVFLQNELYEICPTKKICGLSEMEKPDAQTKSFFPKLLFFRTMNYENNDISLNMKAYIFIKSGALELVVLMVL